MSDILLLAGAVLFYFIPSFVGLRKPNSGSILLLNTLLGWTVVGWIAALVQALAKDPIAAQLRAQPPHQPAASLEASTSRLADLQDLRNRGLLTEEQYLHELSKL